MRQVNVSFVPELASPERFAGKATVVIDVLRATTTIVYFSDQSARVDEFGQLVISREVQA